MEAASSCPDARLADVSPAWLMKSLSRGVRLALSADRPKEVRTRRTTPKTFKRAAREEA